jgi:uncharacterized protein YqkB
MPVRKIENPAQFRSNIVSKINLILKNEKNSCNLEKGIFNFSLKEANTRKVVKKWDNPYFVQIYIDKLRSVYLNLTPDILDKLQNNIIKSHQIHFSYQIKIL